MMSCELEQSMKGLVDKLSTTSQGFQEIQPLQKYSDGVYRVSNGQINQIQKLEEIQALPMFQEMGLGKLLDTKSSDSLLGIILGAAMSGTAVSLVSGALPIAGIPSGLLAIGLGLVIASKFAKSGFGNALAKGLIVGGGVSMAYPYLSQMTAGMTGGADGDPETAA